MTAKATGKLVVAGAGGHAKVVAEMARFCGYTVVGATDPQEFARGGGLQVLGDDDILPSLLKKGVRNAAVGIGSVKDTARRRKMRERLGRLGFSLPALKHPKAVVARGVDLGSGTQVMARAVVNPGVLVGCGVVINTGAIIEHDCALNDDVFIGPGAVLGGGVEVGAGAFVGLGAKVLQGVKLGEGCVVGAGAVVTKDVKDGVTVVGVPAKPQ